ncbi:hypothetical protein AURDEDRAFT_127985 [Auricularia subglabra TFB-10046 SS5]|nr:hypothetical protein AURDEDRAFT_127985 [Auricularia subglabra TFB-10046 SS5]
MSDAPPPLVPSDTVSSGADASTAASAGTADVAKPVTADTADAPHAGRTTVADDTPDAALAKLFKKFICSPWKQNVYLKNVPLPLLKRLLCTICGAASPEGFEIRVIGDYTIIRCKAEGIDFAFYNAKKRLFVAWPGHKHIAALDVAGRPRKLTLHVHDLFDKIIDYEIPMRSTHFTYQDLPAAVKREVAKGYRKGVDLLLPVDVPSEERVRQVLPDNAKGVFIGTPRHLQLRIVYGFYPRVSSLTASAGADPIVIVDSDDDEPAPKRKRAAGEESGARKTVVKEKAT